MLALVVGRVESVVCAKRLGDVSHHPFALNPIGYAHEARVVEAHASAAVCRLQRGHVADFAVVRPTILYSANGGPGDAGLVSGALH